MRKFGFLLLFFIPYISYEQTQNCVKIKGNPTTGFKQLLLASYTDYTADTSQTEIVSAAWTCNAFGVPICNFHGLFKYDVSSVPSNSIITSAKLYLYAKLDNINGNLGNPTFGTANTSLLQKVIEPWQVASTGWLNQPATTDVSEKTLPQSTSTTENYVVDITDFVQDWVSHPETNYGMMLKLVAENYYNSMVFNSGLAPDSLQPTLEICYQQVNENCRQLFQFSFGGSGTDIAYDIADAGNNEFYVVGTTDSYGAGGTDIMVIKTDVSGNAIWSKVFGGANDESVRKIKKTSDGGLLITGQTKSFSNPSGDILCLKVTANGSVAWSRKFGVGSPNGDLGMDIIETSDGGYAVAGILNVLGNIADMTVIKLDKNASVVWAKRFDRNDGEDGFSVAEANGTLVAACDLQHFVGASEYGLALTQLNMNDGQLISAKSMTPSSRGLFSPYIFRDVNNNGFWISGHMIDGDSYTQMQQTVLKLDNNFNITQTYKLDINPYTNDFMTGFIPLSNGFITCASPSTNASGYIYQINSDGTVKFAKKISGSADRTFYRLEHIGSKLIAIGKDNTNGNNDFLVSVFSDDGSLNSACNQDTALLNISNPTFAISDFSWTSVTDPGFNNIDAALSNADASVSTTDLCFIDTCINTITPDFTIPDSVCVNTPVTIKNKTTGGSSFYWSFCDADLNATPDASNLGNVGNVLSQPVFIDLTQNDDGNYYGFSINHIPGGLIRYNFGNSLLNMPIVENLGDFNGAIPNQAEGVQIVKENNNWYVVVVGGGDVLVNSSPRIVVINFGNSLANTTASAINWGNIGNMSQPIDFHVFNEDNNWYGFTVNATNNTITRFDFKNTFDIAPTAVNLGNIGNLDYPDGIFAINDNSFWRVFITNGSDNSSITRLDFGSSLLNTPTAVNLGNIDNKLKRPRDIYIIKLCGETIGFVVNELSNEIIKLDFTAGLDKTPTAVSLGNLGNLDFPHSISKLFRVGSDLYSFITNVNSNSITRLQFKGCTSSNIPNSSDSIPPKISYTTPGTYTVHLMVDEGLSTQTSVCRNIVVLPFPEKSPTQDLTFCRNDSVKLVSAVSDAAHYTWSNGEKDSFIYVNQNGTYWVESDYYKQCAIRDSFNCIIKAAPNVSLGNDTSFCTNNSSILLDAGNTGALYVWQDSSTNQTYNANSSGLYSVTVTNLNGCSAADSITINVFPLPDVTTLNDTSLCNGSAIVLTTTSNGGKTFSWTPSKDLSDPNTKNPSASPTNTTQYIVTATSADGCSSQDSVTIGILSSPSVTASADTLICIGKSVGLSASSTDAVQYVWSPSADLNNNAISNPIATPNSSAVYHVEVTDINGCKAEDSLMVSIKQKPVFTIDPSSAGICIGESVVLTASGGDTYQWSPISTVQSPTNASTAVFPTDTTTYEVLITDNVCDTSSLLSATVTLTSLPNMNVSKSNDVDCVLGETKLTASGGVKYVWTPALSLSNPNIANPFATPDTTTMYHVKISNANGCTGEDSVEVKVIKGEAANGYLMPSAFTPDRDGNNDCFGVRKWGYVTNLDFSVYNRWGNMVFHSTNADNCWDGSYRGTRQPAGVYVYQIRAKTICGEVYRKGTVVLIR